MQITMKYPNVHTVRLALTYLIIIMVLCIGFSSILYVTSTAAIETPNFPFQARTSNASERQPTIGNPRSRHNVPQKIDSNNLELINEIHANLIRKLVLLNIGVLVAGGAFSYFLAHRTLLPIEAAMEAQSRFTSDASHELRTPLASMQAESEEVLRTVDLPTRARSLIVSNLEEIERLKGLSESLLQLAHSNTTLTAQPVWADEVSTEAMNGVIKAAQAKDIAIEDLWPHLQVLGDKQSLIQTTVILLDNAIKYSDKQSTIHLEGSREGGFVNLQVRDEGIGIDKNDLSHIFDRFYRVNQPHMKQRIGGHGLGLSIAEKLVKQQNGVISVTSKANEGSTFTIKLPIAKS